MDFLDKIGKKASEAYKMTADKTGKIAKETKLKLKISEIRTQINDLYEEIGKKVYEEHIREDGETKEDIREDLENLCVKIDVLSDEIEDLLMQCLELRDKKQCKNCYVEIEKEYKYCPNCGAKQDGEEEKEEYENINLFEENEKSEEQEESSRNLEKTVKIEANVEEENEDIETY